MKKFWRYNGLSVTVFALFFLFWAGQTFTGLRVYNEEQRDHHQPAIGLAQYFRTGHFIEGTFENWESEFLQMGAYVLLTVFLFQKGSSESNDPDGEPQPSPNPNKPDAPAPVKKGGLILKIYENSLAFAFFAMFFLSFALHAVGGAMDYSAQQVQEGKPAVSTVQFMETADFWFQSFQNWQSEFLAVGCIVVFSIWLRQKNSPESKPVDAPHSQTGD